MNPKRASVDALLSGRKHTQATTRVSAWGSINIALCKYWGKRDEQLNLPISDSLSILLPKHGTEVTLTLTGSERIIRVNDQRLEDNNPAYQQLTEFVDLFPSMHSQPYSLQFDFNIPVAAGFASSAACYAGLVKAIDRLHDWELPTNTLSALARLGSGSASRSFSFGFSHWQAGRDPLGCDSFARPLAGKWSALRLGFVTVSAGKKKVSSREGMKRTRETSPLFDAWHASLPQDIDTLKNAIEQHDFNQFGICCEQNALGMHATMLSAWPPLTYSDADTQAIQKRVWDLRDQGLALYFTQDAGPNIKLLFLEKDEHTVREHFPQIDIAIPFECEREA